MRRNREIRSGGSVAVPSADASLTDASLAYAHQVGGVETDIKKWSFRNISCPIQYVHLVTRIESLDDVATDFFKYGRGERPNLTLENLRRAEIYFRGLQGQVGVPMCPRRYPELWFSAASQSPYQVSVRLNFFLVDQVSPRSKTRLTTSTGDVSLSV